MSGSGVNSVGVMCVSHAKATHLDPCIISLAELGTKDLVYMPTCSPYFRTCHTFIVIKVTGTGYLMNNS